MMLPEIEYKIDPQDIARITKKLNKWQGEPLLKRTDKAVRAGWQLLIKPISAGASRHRVTGLTERTVKVLKLRKRPGEMFAYKVGVTTWYGHFPITGVYGNPGDPYVDAAYQSLNGQVRSFVDNEITRLA